MASPVDLHPKRRQKREETGTSRFSAPLIPQEDVEMNDGPARREKDENEGDDASPKKSMRQMRLDFSSGVLSTKKPFRNPLGRDDNARKSLAEVATETWKLLPGLLQTRPDVGTDGHVCQNESLDATRCPNLASIKVRVISSDTIDAALNLQRQRSNSSIQKPVALLNMANAKTAGGGWKHGALAQEEAICYRTSLIMTLKHKDYPIPDEAAIYSPRILVIRDSIKTGHELVDCTDPRKLEVVSVISCAAVCQPSLKKDAKTGGKTYALIKDRKLMVEKMRVVLRTAIRRKHRQIVLGALGCGAFGNPNVEVAMMWRAVLQEPEFSGGWWEDVIFAVLGDSKADSNFKVFHDELDGLLLK